MWSGDQGLNDPIKQEHEDPEGVIALLKDEENKSKEEE